MLSTPDPVARPIRALLEVFEDDLDGVAFPDVGAEALNGAAERVRERASGVEAARAALMEAEAALRGEQARLEQLASRALSYARIYAEERPELAARLAEIVLGGAEAPPAKKRGRPRKRERGAEGDASAEAMHPAVLPFDEAPGLGVA
jgi:hypothetical protein